MTASDLQNLIARQLVGPHTTKVELKNPAVVATTRSKVGEFASICKVGMDQCGPVSNDVYQRIGDHCLSSGHFSPSRHIFWEFTVTGMSTVASHQLVRHHVGVAINQLSGVFTETSFETNPLVLPGKIKEILSKTENSSIANNLSYALMLIEESMKDLKAIDPTLTNSDLRYLMPRACSTAMNIAVTPEALIHICNERLCSKAQWEIRGIVRSMANAVIAVDPWWKQWLQPKCVRFNGCNEKLGCGLFNSIQTKKFGEVNVEPLDIRIKGIRCKGCSAILLTKDDDPSPLNSDGMCRKCARENETKE